MDGLLQFALSVSDPKPVTEVAQIWRTAAQSATIGIFIILFVAALSLARPILLPVASAFVTTFGGTTKEYHADLHPGSLLGYNVTLDQVMTALTKSNTDVGGNYLTIGAQNFNVRGLGLIRDLDDIENAVVTEWTPKSQSYRAMGKKAFAESKDAVLGYVADLIGVAPAELAKQGAAA